MSRSRKWSQILEDDVEILFYDPKIVDKPTRAVVIEFGEDMYKVAYDDKVAWIDMKYVKS